MKGAMASDPITQKLMYKIARAYYDERCTQQEIGERFGLSRVKVGRLLEKARRENIVKISFLEPKDNTYLEIENQIEKKYKIDEVLLVPARDDHKRTLRGIGQMTADYLERIITGNEVIGLTWGNTLLCVVNALHANNSAGVATSPAFGHLDHLKQICMVQTLRFAQRKLWDKSTIAFSPGDCFYKNDL